MPELLFMDYAVASVYIAQASEIIIWAQILRNSSVDSQDLQKLLAVFVSQRKQRSSLLRGSKEQRWLHQEAAGLLVHQHL